MPFPGEIQGSALYETFISAQPLKMTFTADHVKGPVPSTTTPQKQNKPLWREIVSQEM